LDWAGDWFLIMIWRWLICFSGVLAILEGATVSGRVELRDSKDPAVRRRQDYSGVVVWLERIDKGAPKANPVHAKMIQKDKTFTPHVLAVPTGSSVEFPNLDPLFHNAFSNYDGQVFDVGLYPPGTSRTVRFARPGIVRIFCNIHSSMSAIIAVVDSSWFDTTKPDGRFEIRDVPQGEYRLRVFHERTNPASLASLTQPVSVFDAPIAIPAIAISENGFLAVPHKDKYGRDYKPAPQDSGAYPVTRK
jgi:plastocyanin